MKTISICFFSLLIYVMSYGQTNMKLTNPKADSILKGKYNPADYTPSIINNSRDTIVKHIIAYVSGDSLYNSVERLQHFHNRNAGSDTVSEVRGIGAARRWIYKKFQETGAGNENRLIVSYLDFDMSICGKNKHRNVIAVLPGLDTSDHKVLLVEAHMDSRCETNCDTSCFAPGAEDDASGVALLIELARVMSRLSFDHTIVFSANTSEEQGLNGAKAFAGYMKTNKIPLMACFNNDMVAGITCGKTSAAPGCPYEGYIDSMKVRIFSFSTANDSTAKSTCKQLARYTTLQLIEEINPVIGLPYQTKIMIKEDREGRSGDHVPFRQNGHPAIRIISMNENGDGSGTAPDHQHSARDVVGVDTNTIPDGILDTLYIDKNYHRRNTLLNGVNIGLLAISPPSPTPQFTNLPAGLEINMQGQDTIYKHYRVGIRKRKSGTLYFDSVLTFKNTTKLVIDNLTLGKTYYFSVMNVENEVESFFAPEYTMVNLGMENIQRTWGIDMMQNYPNPSGNGTIVMIHAGENVHADISEIVVNDIAGKSVLTIPVKIISGENQIIIPIDKLAKGIYTYSLIIDHAVIQTRKMIINK